MARERITRADLAVRTASLSRRLNGLRVETQRRNGYVGLDLYDAHGLIETLKTGTAREVFDYLCAMERALALVNR